MAEGRWIKGAIKRPGAFRAKAEKAGMSTSAYAAKQADNPNASPRTRKQAQLAKTLGRMNKRRGRKKSRSSR